MEFENFSDVNKLSKIQNMIYGQYTYFRSTYAASALLQRPFVCHGIESEGGFELQYFAHMCLRIFGGHVCFESNVKEGFDEILADFSPSHVFNPKP